MNKPHELVEMKRIIDRLRSHIKRREPIIDTDLADLLREHSEITIPEARLRLWPHDFIKRMLALNAELGHILANIKVQP